MCCVRKLSSTRLRRFPRVCKTTGRKDDMYICLDVDVDIGIDIDIDRYMITYDHLHLLIHWGLRSAVAQGQALHIFDYEAPSISSPNPYYGHMHIFTLHRSEFRIVGTMRGAPH
jgi:hypothetical protein